MHVNGRGKNHVLNLPATANSSWVTLIVWTGLRIWILEKKKTNVELVPHARQSRHGLGASELLMRSCTAWVFPIEQACLHLHLSLCKIAQLC